jgi:orotate phosphoribosyltransferase
VKDWLVRGDFQLHSGERSSFKIECDALTGEETASFAHIIRWVAPVYHRVGLYQEVRGIPTGGIMLAMYLESGRDLKGRGTLAKDQQVVLLVDDVYTTGQSMERARIELADEGYSYNNVVGAVMFARRKPPPWVYAVFQFNDIE